MRRNDARICTDFYLNKVVDGVPYLVRARDLSQGGVFLDKLLEPDFGRNTRVAVEFCLPESGDVMWADVEPIWEEDSRGVGFRFRDLTPRVKRLLNEFISAKND